MLAVFCGLRAIFPPAFLEDPATRVGIAAAHTVFNILCTLRERRPGQDAQNRVFKQDEELLEGRDIPQARDRAGHALHAEHQRGEAQQDGAGVLLFCGPAEQVEDDAGHAQHRRKGAGLQKLDQYILFKNPILGVLAGAALTALIQSSSASVGILQALAVTGQVSYGAAIPIIMGQNIGTCATAMLSSVGG